MCDGKVKAGWGKTDSYAPDTALGLENVQARLFARLPPTGTEYGKIDPWLPWAQGLPIGPGINLSDFGPIFYYVRMNS